MKLGIDLGGTTMAAALVDDAHHILYNDVTETKRERPYMEIIRDMAELGRRLLENAGLREDDIEAVGIGCPGILDRDAGVVVYSNNIRWDNVDLRGCFQRHLNRPVYVDNDANCAALGEYIAGAARGYDSSLCVTLGTGVGGGLILGGKIHSGFNGAAGCFGHTVIVSGGEPCSCGRRGCFEAYASASALIRMGNEAAAKNPGSMLARLVKNGNRLDGKNIFECAGAGDAAAKTLVAEYTRYVAEGITDFVNSLQPDVIVIGGGISSVGEALLAPIREQVARDVFCKEMPLPAIRAAHLGNNAGIIGAAFLQDYQRQADIVEGEQAVS